MFSELLRSDSLSPRGVMRVALGRSRGLRRLLRAGLVFTLSELPLRPTEPRPSAWRAVAAGPLHGLPERPPVTTPDTIYEWRPGSYRVGVVVEWEAIRLVCCAEHTTLASAEHPWHVGKRTLEMQACLWAPDGDVEAARLKTLVIDRRDEFGDRLRAVALIAAGERKAA